MTRISPNISMNLAPAPILLVRQPLPVIKKVVEPIVKAVANPALQKLEKAFAQEVLRRAGSKLFLKIGGEVVVKQIIMTELAETMARIPALKLASPSTMLLLVGGIHVGELTIQQICVNYGLSLAAITISAVAEEQAKRITKINPIAQFSDAVIGTNWGDIAISQKRAELERVLSAKYKSEQANNEKMPEAAPALNVQKQKAEPYRQVPKVAKLPIVEPHKPVPNVLKLRVVAPNNLLPSVLPLPAVTKVKIKKGNPSILKIEPENPKGVDFNSTPQAAAQTQTSSSVQKATDENQDNLPQIASRTVVYIGKNNKGEDELVGNSTYIKIDPKHPEKTENAVINRLVHRENITGASDKYKNRVLTGHDAIHLISGFGLDPKSATTIGAPFPMTGIDAERLGLNPPASQRRGLNGILQEAITEALYFNMVGSDTLDNIELFVPHELQYYCKKVLENLEYFTNPATPFHNIKSGTDFARQARELSSIDLGSFRYLPTNQKSGRVYRPFFYNTTPHIKNFSKLLEEDADVRKELRKNMITYLNFVSQAEYNKAHGLAMPTKKIRFKVSAQTTRKLITVALKGLEELYLDFKTPAILELIIFYKALLRGDKNPTPTVVFSPTQTTKNT